MINDILVARNNSAIKRTERTGRIEKKAGNKESNSPKKIQYR